MSELIGVPARGSLGTIGDRPRFSHGVLPLIFKYRGLSPIVGKSGWPEVHELWRYPLVPSFPYSRGPFHRGRSDLGGRWMPPGPELHLLSNTGADVPHLAGRSLLNIVRG
jgi:hypothetical protein